MESAIEIGSLWARDGKQYMVAHVGQTVKDADAANWQPAVGYQKVMRDEGDGEPEPIRVRTESDFRAKFSPVA
jgi:hypothetical protein